MPSDPPSIGTRLSHSDSLGTVRFVGSVHGTSGTWLGVEWDDKKRGKHDGVKDGQRYFTCIVPNSGSFIRPNAAISYGITFITALTAKYIEIPHGGTPGSEKVVLGSSSGAIQVEAVGLDRIRNNLARLERLREVSLNNELVSKSDSPGKVAATCPGIHGLDLSKNLIPSWDTVADITRELHNLRRLSLNQNRLRPPQTLNAEITAFRQLEELQISATLTTWDELRDLLSYMPTLRSVEMGYNRLRTLSLEVTSARQASWCTNVSLQDINLDGNELQDFVDISSAMNNLPSLQRLILTSNCVVHITPPLERESNTEYHGASPSPLRSLKQLALAFNRLSTWRDIDLLQRWCPDLESLTLAGNPLVDDPVHASYARAFTVAKIPSLKTLDGAAISPRERIDSELLYLSHISKQAFSSDAERRAAHPQWQYLCTKHGAPDAPPASDPLDTLGNRLINVRIHHCDAAPPAKLAPDELEGFLYQSKSEATLRVLLSMSVQTLRMKILKSFKVSKSRHKTARLWMLLPSGAFTELNDEYAARDLAYWGVEGGTQFILVDSD